MTVGNLAWNNQKNAIIKIWTDGIHKKNHVFKMFYIIFFVQILKNTKLVFENIKFNIQEIKNYQWYSCRRKFGAFCLFFFLFGIGAV